MADNILVVDHEPRYNDRVRQALAGHPIHASFAKDGEEALRALDSEQPSLIVLSSVIPKISTPDLIRAIRSRGEQTPILLTVSGYNGKFPEQDAARLGASDILPKPFSESEFLVKVQQMLGAPAENKFTSDDIFGEVLEEARAPVVAAPRRPMSSKDDIDKLVADSLAGVMPKKRESTMPGTTAIPRPKTSQADLDKILNDSLSGLEKRKTASGIPKPAASPEPERASQVAPDRVLSTPPPVFEPPAPAKEEPEPADGVRFGQYVLLEKIATGGMAEVWKARKRGEEGFQKIVAIKKILPHLSDNQEFIEMFVDEAKLAAQLNHSNIIHIYDLGKIQSSYFIAMEYVDGHDLKTILKRGQDRDHPLGIELSLFIASKIGSALDYAHRRRDLNEKEMELVHRDVSPQNVLVSQDGDIKLCDFGIAKAASKASHTQAGALKGKLQYMSPEQAWGQNIDRRSDVFALAAVLFEMLTGKKLFTGDNEISILEQVRGARVKPPSELNDEITPEIDRVVLKGLQKDAADRYQSAGEMAKDIDSILYNFRPTPTSADLAIYMHRLWSAEAGLPQVEPAAEEEKKAAPVIVPVAPVHAGRIASAPPHAVVPAPAGVPMPAWDGPRLAFDPEKRSPVVPIAIAAILIAAVAGGFFYFRSRGSAGDTGSATATAAPMPQPARTAPSETGTVVELTDSATGLAVPAATLAPATATLDSSLVDQEVQRLLAAERTRLEQQALTRERQAQTATAAPPPLTRAVIPVAPAPQTAAPVPETATTAPAPAETVAETRTAPPPTETAAAPAPVREGDLVPPGTEGLTPPRVTRYGSVPYPPMAKMQKVQGTVLLNVLVSESGQVLEVRVIKGINRAVGLNEAAIDIVRRSSFAAGMKDGVRVRSWATVPVSFKL